MALPTFCAVGPSGVLDDVNAAALTRAQATIERNLDRLVAKERISAKTKPPHLSRLTTTTEMHGAVADAELVVEAATERLDLKLKIFEQIDARRSASPFWPPIHRAFPSRALQRPQAARQGHWDALHESGAHHEVGGGHPRL